MPPRRRCGKRALRLLRRRPISAGAIARFSAATRTATCWRSTPTSELQLRVQPERTRQPRLEAAAHGSAGLVVDGFLAVGPVQLARVERDAPRVLTGGLPVE